ncbi:DUF4126 domain-containing protein [Georgenia subflava]|uniref:DUF4126 family protein n=1 Tax=Georgenia subflava TaxID=1622177 RepID=A0A6N7EFD4_9MICO|nr:DUF4126 domain-containing protein [Georgenia subflava]MPV36740.1 DUF4126 family protein [Georgenia subflava]
MLELLTGSGLAMAAGLNAYIPLLGLGLLSRFTDLLSLPAGWQWLESTPALAVLAVLLLVEVVADKIPAVDSVNDVLQTAVRPVSGGMVFAAGSSSETTAVTDPASLLQDWRWVPVVLGVLLALTTHTTKTLSRPVVNTATVGVGAPVVSTAEDASAVGLVIASVLLPVLVGLLVVVVLVLLVLAVRRRLAARSTPPRYTAPGASEGRPDRR